MPYKWMQCYVMWYLGAQSGIILYYIDLFYVLFLGYRINFDISLYDLIMAHVSFMWPEMLTTFTENYFVMGEQLENGSERF